GPLKVVAPDRAEGVERLAADEEPRAPAAFERPRVDLREADAASRDLGLRVALVAGPRELSGDERLDQAEPLPARQPRERTRWIDAGQLRKRGGQPIRQLGAERPGDRTRAAGSQCRIPAARVAPGPPDG